MNTNDELYAALRDIRMVAALGAAFGHAAEPRTLTQMLEHKDARLKQILSVCARVGVEGWRELPTGEATEALGQAVEDKLAQLRRDLEAFKL